MGKYILKRLATIVVVMLLVGFIVCVLVHLIPGDLAMMMLGEDASEANLNQVREQMHLNDPIIVQYFYWLKDAIHGDFGYSMQYSEECGALILSRMKVTMYLGIMALCISWILGIILGTVSAYKVNTVIDQVITVIANLGVAVPVFWIAILLVYVFAFKLNIFPISGYIPMKSGLGEHVKSIILPLTVLMLRPTAVLTRQTRSAVLEAIGQDYVRTARSKGLSEQIVLFEHVLRNAMTPIITQIGLQVRNVIGGAVLVETVFNFPGMGRLIIDSVKNKDILVVQGTIVMIALVVSLSSMVVDILYGFFNPRVRVEKLGG